MSAHRKYAKPTRMSSVLWNLEHNEEFNADNLSIYSNDSVKDMDGRFFEYFSSLEDSGTCALAEDRTDGSTFVQSALYRRPTLSESLLQSLSEIESKEKEHLSQKKKESLYAELLYTIKHKIGSEATTQNSQLQIDQLYSYGQNSFQLSKELHNKILAVVSKAKPPILVLNVTILEARDLEAKDADGFSDPYCMMGIIPGRLASSIEKVPDDVHKSTKEKHLVRKLSSSFRDILKKQHGKEKDPTKDLIPAKFIQCTKVIPNCLNPCWNEHFKCDVEDILADKLHIDVWDHDDEESVFESVKTLNQAKDMKGIGRVFKQIAQSARTKHGESMDDFLGAIDISLYEIPSTGHTTWYDLCGRTSKSKVQGKIKVSVSLATREDRGLPIEDNFNDVQQHEDLLNIFIDYERGCFQGNPAEWAGILSQEADLILHQHAVQGDISPTQRAFCYWLSFSDKYKKEPFLPSCLLNILKSLEENWGLLKLSGEEDARLGKSFREFLDYFVRTMEDIRSVFPATQPQALERLDCLLECVKFLLKSGVYSHCCNQAEQYNINAGISQSIKNGSKHFFNKVWASINPLSRESQCEKIQGLTTLTNIVKADIMESSSYYNPIFERVLHFPYFDSTFKVMERKLCCEVRRVLEEDLSVIHLLDSESLHSAPHVVKDARKLLISQILNLYFSIQSVAKQQKHIRISDVNAFLIKRYQDWFSRAVQDWLIICKEKLEARVNLAVQQDTFAKVEDTFECSTSAIDVADSFMQIAKFWKKLKWKNEEESFAFSLKLSDDICQSAVLYTDLLHGHMKKKSYFDDEDQFDVQRPLCTCLNDVEYIRRTLVNIPEGLCLSQVVKALERHHNLDPPLDQPSHFSQVFHALMESALKTIEAKISLIAHKISERMKVDIKKNVVHLFWAMESKPIHEAIEPLVEYLDENLLTLYKYLLRRNFMIILAAIWNACLQEFQDLIIEQEETSPETLQKIVEALEILTDFFNADDKGLSRHDIHSDLFMKLTSFLGCQEKPTEDIITLFYKDMALAQNEARSDKRSNKKYHLGVLGIRCHYQPTDATLSVEIKYCKEIMPLDSNGLSDPFIIWELCPRHLFPDFHEFKTTIKKKTLNPVYDETFTSVVSQDLVRQDGACIRFALMDYDFVLKNDFGGEAYLSLKDVPGVIKASNTISAHSKPLELIFLKPLQIQENLNLVALKRRSKDTRAQQFVANRIALAKEVQTNIINNGLTFRQ